MFLWKPYENITKTKQRLFRRVFMKTFWKQAQIKGFYNVFENINKTFSNNNGFLQGSYRNPMKTLFKQAQIKGFTRVFMTTLWKQTQIKGFLQSLCENFLFITISIFFRNPFLKSNETYTKQGFSVGFFVKTLGEHFKNRHK